MADFINIPFDLGSVAAMASADAASFWIGIAINLVISTVVGGVVLIIVLGLFNRIYGEMLDYKKAFLVVLIANLASYVGVAGLLSPVLGGIPLMGLILPLLIWVLLLKLFFEDMSFLHAFIVGAVFFALTLLAIPYLTGQVASIAGF
jgi:hypothetical protein